MATLEGRRWGDLTGLTRPGRSPSTYEVYLPDRLNGRLFTLHGEQVAPGSAAALSNGTEWFNSGFARESSSYPDTQASGLVSAGTIRLDSAPEPLVQSGPHRRGGVPRGCRSGIPVPPAGREAPGYGRGHPARDRRARIWRGLLLSRGPGLPRRRDPGDGVFVMYAEGGSTRASSTNRAQRRGPTEPAHGPRDRKGSGEARRVSTPVVPGSFERGSLDDEQGFFRTTVERLKDEEGAALPTIEEV